MATTTSSEVPVSMPPAYSTDSQTSTASSSKDTPVSTEKELAVPRTGTDTDKQVFSRTADSEKQVYSSLTEPDDSSKQVYSPHQHVDSNADTSKQAIPHLPPVSMEKEVLLPTDNTDKQATSTLSHSSSNNTSLSRTNAYQAFRVEKYTPYGLILPVDQKLALKSIDPLTNEDRGAVYVTGEMSWVDVATVLPPMFELFSTRAGASGMGESLEMVGRSVPRGWEGVSGVKADVECSTLQAGGGSGGREKWEVSRRGLGRTYKLRRNGDPEVQCVWKGTSSSVKEILRSNSTSTSAEGGKSKKEKVHKGNLKLVSGKEGDGEVLAVWQQARDSNVLGDLIVFNEARGKISTEVIVVTCLTAVSAERASGMNWFGGFGK